jgi:hypothetical protein
MFNRSSKGDGGSATLMAELNVEAMRKCAESF